MDSDDNLPELFDEAQAPYSSQEAVRGIIEFTNVLTGGVFTELGGALGDAARAMRFDRQIKLLARAKERCEERGVDPAKVLPDIFLQSIDAGGTTDDDTLRDLYANLLVTQMDAASEAHAHPAFVHIIKQLLPAEARLLHTVSQSPTPDFATIDIEVGGIGVSTNARGLRNLSMIAIAGGIDDPRVAADYTDNLIRLRLLEKSTHSRIADEGQYDQIRRRFKLEEWKASHGNLRSKLIFHEVIGVLRVTSFGEKFLRACVSDHLFWPA